MSGPHFFTERVINIWNCLPSDTVDFSSLTAFKRTIKYVNFSDRVSKFRIAVLRTGIVCITFAFIFVLFFPKGGC